MCECEWIETVLVVLKDERKYFTIKKKSQRELEPIIIVHGLPDDEELSDNYDSILAIMKTAATESYQELLKGHRSAIDVVTLAISQLEEKKSTKETTVRNAILMDNVGRVGCVSALTVLDHPILLARRLTHEHQDVMVVQENMEGRRLSDVKSTESESGVFSNNIRSWGVIVRDRKENLAGGRSLWTFNDDPTNPSVSAAATVPGCGLFVDEKSCCSVSGDDQAIYIHAPARKIISRLKENLSNIVALRKELNDFMEQNPEAPIAVVLLGINNKPLIVYKSKYFPWAYCHRGVLNYGHTKEKSFSEDIALEMPLDCQCKR